MVKIEINGREYSLATTLRVAYEMQKRQNHKPYTEVFQELGSMPLEEQIGFLYVAFKVANPDEAASFSERDFLNAYLDEGDLKNLMQQIRAVTQGITGVTDEDVASAAAKNSGN